MSDTSSRNAPVEGNWDEDFKEKEVTESKGTGFKKAEYMDMSKNGTYVIRLVGRHVRFRQLWKPFGTKITIRDDGAAKSENPAWQAGWLPSKRFAINVLDKTGLKEGEVAKLKVLEKGPSVFKHFSNFKTVTGKDPAGKEGYDFSITVKIPMKNGKPNKMKTEYSVMPIGATPFTPQELKLIYKTDEKGEIIRGEDKKPISNLWNLQEIYKPTAIAKVKELWDALAEDKKVAPKQEWDKDKEDRDEDKSSAKDEPTVDQEMFDEPSDKNEDSANLF